MQNKEKKEDTCLLNLAYLTEVFEYVVHHENITLPEVDTCVFLSGSLVDGLETPFSDFDFYVLLPGGYQIPETIEHICQSKYGLAEITFIRIDEINKISKKLNIGYIDGSELSSYELLLSHRIISGVAVRNEPKLKDLKSLFPVANICSYWKKLNQVSCEIGFKAAWGNIAIDETNCAVLNAKDLLNYALKLYLALRGNTNFNNKTITKVAYKILGSDDNVYRGYLKLSFSGTFDDTSSKHSYIMDIFGFAQYVYDCYLVDQLFDEKISSGLYKNYWSNTFLTKNNALKKHGLLRPFIERGVVYLAASEPMFEISSETALVLSQVDNSSSLEDLTNKLIAIPALSISPVSVSSNIEHLLKSNLVYQLPAFWLSQN